MTRIILEKLQPYLKINEEQQGFRPNRSTTDAIFIVRQIVEKAIEYNVPAFMCFVDLRKAFDRVRLSDVINILKEKEVPTQLTTTIKYIYTNGRTKIQIGNKTTREIECGGGIRQGDSLSPILFNLIMNKLIDSTKLLDGYRMGNNKINIICYADDAILIADNEDNLQRLLHKMVTTAKTYNMTVSTTKTKSMVISREPIRCKLEVKNKMIEQVMEFQYLGIDVSSERNTYKEVRKQTMKGARISGYLRDIIWKNKHLSQESKVKIYRTIVRPVMTYAADTRAETSKTKQLLRTTEMNTLRTITGRTRRDRVRNSEIRRQCAIEDVIRFNKRRKKEWNNHITRAEDNRLIKIVRDSIPNGKRNPGRPLKRWAESWITTSNESNA